MVPFSFAGEEFALTSACALYWPREAALLVADLHLEKASFFARFGQMLPPYDSRETLERVDVLRRLYELWGWKLKTYPLLQRLHKNVDQKVVQILEDDSRYRKKSE